MRLLFATKPLVSFRPKNTQLLSFIRSGTTAMSESNQAPHFDQPRMVVKKVLAKQQYEGDGAVVRRSIGR